MPSPIVGQILTENAYAQSLHFDQEAWLIIAAYERIYRWARRLSVHGGQNRHYCIALTLLAVSGEAQVEPLKRYFDDPRQEAQPALLFEQLQYRMNQAAGWIEKGLERGARS